MGVALADLVPERAELPAPGDDRRAAGDRGASIRYWRIPGNSDRPVAWRQRSRARANMRRAKSVPAEIPDW